MTGLLLWAVTASAAEPERLITYDEAMSAAVGHNPTLARSGFDEDSAEGGLRAAWGAFDPLASLDGGWSTRSQRGYFQGFPFEATSRSWNLEHAVSGQAPTGTGWSVNLGMDRNFSDYRTDFGEGFRSEGTEDTYTSSVSASVSQALLKGHRLSYNLQNVTRAKETLDQARLTRDATRQQVLSDLAHAYWTWVYAAQAAEIATESVSVAEEALRVGSLRVDAGELAPVERTRLEAALVQTQADVLDRQLAVRRQADAVLLLIGEPPGSAVRPSTLPDALPFVEVDAGKAVEVALAQNPALRLRRAEHDAASVGVKNARHALMPSLEATLSAGLGAQDDTLGGAIGGLVGQNVFPYVSMQGRLEVPLGNRAALGARDQAAASLHRVDIEVLEQEAQVRSQTVLAADALAAARRRIELADANARLASETLAAEEALAAKGRAIQKDVLEARAGVENARVEAVRARTDWQVALVDILALQGQLDASGAVGR